MQKMSNGDYFDEKMRRGDRSKEARRISPPLKLLLKSPKLRGSTAPKSAHLHRGREQGVWSGSPLGSLRPGLHESLQPCSRAARKWRENEEMRRKWRENEEMERD